MKISIKDLTFYCIIGILDFERQKEQKVVVDICFKYKYTDSKSFIDYSQIATEIENIMKKEKFELIEEAINYLRKFLEKKYKIEKLKIQISKPNILKNCIVTIKK